MIDRQKRTSYHAATERCQKERRTVMRAVRLRTVDLKNPLGIDDAAPMLSWNCERSGTRREKRKHRRPPSLRWDFCVRKTGVRSGSAGSTRIVPSGFRRIIIGNRLQWGWICAARDCMLPLWGHIRPGSTGRWSAVCWRRERPVRQTSLLPDL